MGWGKRIKKVFRKFWYYLVQQKEDRVGMATEEKEWKDTNLFGTQKTNMRTCGIGALIRHFLMVRDCELFG